jgi:hypothetical protein
MYTNGNYRTDRGSVAWSTMFTEATPLNPTYLDIYAQICVVICDLSHPCYKFLSPQLIFYTPLLFMAEGGGGAIKHFQPLGLFLFTANYVKPCARSDPNFNECAIQHARETLASPALERGKGCNQEGK